jgi:hypothetical protein
MAIRNPTLISNLERSTIMAARGIALGRIIDWFKNCDPEEGKFAIHRAGNILQERMAKVDRADAHGKVKRTRRTRAEISADRADVQMHEDAKAAQGVHG